MEEPIFVPGEVALMVHSDQNLNDSPVTIDKVYKGDGYHPLIGNFKGFVYEFKFGFSVIKWPEPLLKKIDGKYTMDWIDCPFVPEL